MEKVSDSTLNQLLDSLFQRRILNMGEMESARIKPRDDRARDVIDMVLRKGQKASSSMIKALCELDPCLSNTLNLC